MAARVLLLLLAAGLFYGQALANNDCEKLRNILGRAQGKIESQFEALCEIILVEEDFRQRVLSKAKGKSWQQLNKEAKGNPKIKPLLNVNVSDITRMGELLNTSKLPPSIKVLEVNNKFTLKRRGKGWYVSSIDLPALKANINLPKILQGFDKAHSALDQGKPISEAMRHYQKAMSDLQ